MIIKGIGKELAIEYSSFGVNLILTGRDLKRLEETRDLCLKNGAKSVKIIPSDLSDHKDVLKFVDFVLKNFDDGIDILVLNHVLVYKGLVVLVIEFTIYSHFSFQYFFTIKERSQGSD